MVLHGAGYATASTTYNDDGAADYDDDNASAVFDDLSYAGASTSGAADYDHAGALGAGGAVSDLFLAFIWGVGLPLVVRWVVASHGLAREEREELAQWWRAEDLRYCRAEMARLLTGQRPAKDAKRSKGAT